MHAVTGGDLEVVALVDVSVHSVVVCAHFDLLAELGVVQGTLLALLLHGNCLI